MVQDVPQRLAHPWRALPRQFGQHDSKLQGHCMAVTEQVHAMRLSIRSPSHQNPLYLAQVILLHCSVDFCLSFDKLCCTFNCGS